MDENTIQLTIKSEELTFEKKISQFKAGQIIAFLDAPDNGLGLKSSANKLLDQTVNDSPNRDGHQTLSGLINEASPESNPERIVCIAKFLKDSTGINTITDSDLKNQFQNAGLQTPKNLLRDIKKAIRKDYLAKSNSGEKGEYYITSNGEKQVLQGFSSLEKRTSTSKSRSKKTPKSIREEIKALTIVGILNGVSDFNTMSTKSRKILWTLNFASENSIDVLSPVEIEYIAFKLRESILTRDFNALNKVNMLKGFVAIKDGNFFITDKGISEIKSNGTGSH